MSTFSERLRDCIDKSGTQQKQLACDLKLSAARLNNYLMGRSEPSFDVLCSLCRALHISSDYLLGLSDVQHAVPPVSVNSCSVPRNPLDSLDPDLRSKAEGYIDSLREQQADRNAKQKEA